MNERRKRQMRPQYERKKKTNEQKKQDTNEAINKKNKTERKNETSTQRKSNDKRTEARKAKQEMKEMNKYEVGPELNRKFKQENEPRNAARTAAKK